MYCSKCGKEVSEQAKFCNYCGNPLQQNIVDTKNKTNDIEKTTFMFMQLVTVGLVVAFLWFLFKPIAWIEPCQKTDYKKADMNIIQYTVNVINEAISHINEHRYNEKDAMVVELGILVYMVSMCCLVLEIILILEFAYNILKQQKYKIEFLWSILVIEIVRAIMLVWNMNSLTNILYFQLDYYFNPYYAVYVKNVVIVLLLIALHTIYFKNRKDVD